VHAMGWAERQTALAALSGAWPNLLRFGSRTSQWLSERLSNSEVEVFRESGIQARNRGDFEAAHGHYRAAAEDAEGRRDPIARADTLLDLAQNAVDRARYDDAAESLRMAEEQYRELNDPCGRTGLIEVKNLWG